MVKENIEITLLKHDGKAYQRNDTHLPVYSAAVENIIGVTS